MDKFLQLLCPALEWIVKGLSSGKDTLKLDEIFKWCILQNHQLVIEIFVHILNALYYYFDYASIFSGLLINAIVNTYPGNYLALKTEYLISLISNWEYEGLFKYFSKYISYFVKHSFNLFFFSFFFV